MTDETATHMIHVNCRETAGGWWCAESDDLKVLSAKAQDKDGLKREVKRALQEICGAVGMRRPDCRFTWYAYDEDNEPKTGRQDFGTYRRGVIKVDKVAPDGEYPSCSAICIVVVKDGVASLIPQFDYELQVSGCPQGVLHACLWPQKHEIAKMEQKIADEARAKEFSEFLARLKKPDDAAAG